MGNLSKFPLAAMDAVKSLPNLDSIESETEEQKMPVKSVNVNAFIGKKIGHLTVEKHAGKDDKNNTLVTCLCSCGTRKNVVLSNLRAGLIKSCGHLRSGAKPQNKARQAQATPVAPLVQAAPKQLDTAPLEMSRMEIQAKVPEGTDLTVPEMTRLAMIVGQAGRAD
jgi:hypothetical protein